VLYVKADGVTAIDAETLYGGVRGRTLYTQNPGQYPYVRVTVNATYSPMTPLVSNLTGSLISLAAQATMAIE
jgi:hypothetical protein